MRARLDIQRLVGTLQEVDGAQVAPLELSSGKMIMPPYFAVSFNLLANPVRGKA